MAYSTCKNDRGFYFQIFHTRISTERDNNRESLAETVGPLTSDLDDFRSETETLFENAADMWMTRVHKVKDLIVASIPQGTEDGTEICNEFVPTDKKHGLSPQTVFAWFLFSLGLVLAIN